MATITSYKDLAAWQHAMRLTAEIYQLTAQLPANERLGLSASLQQAAVDIPALLAAGSRRGRSGLKAACLNGVRAAAEVETLLLIVQQTYPSLPVDDLLVEISDIQNGLVQLARRLAKPAAQRSV